MKVKLFGNDSELISRGVGAKVEVGTVAIEFEPDDTVQFDGKKIIISGQDKHLTAVITTATWVQRDIIRCLTN